MDKDILQAAEAWAQSEGMDPHSAGKVLAKMEASDFVVFCDAAKNGDHATMSDVYHNSTKLDETFNSSIDNPASQFQAKPGKGTANHGAELNLSSPEAPTAPESPTPQDMSQMSKDIASMQQGDEIGIKQDDGQVQMQQLQGIDQQDGQVVVQQPNQPGEVDVVGLDQVDMVDMNDPEVQRILKLAGGQQ